MTKLQAEASFMMLIDRIPDKAQITAIQASVDVENDCDNDVIGLNEGEPISVVRMYGANLAAFIRSDVKPTNIDLFLADFTTLVKTVLAETSVVGSGSSLKVSSSAGSEEKQAVSSD